jgi:hypothetical protein
LAALLSLAISSFGALFAYSEPMLRLAVKLAAFVDPRVIIALAGFVVARPREPAA